MAPPLFGILSTLLLASSSNNLQKQQPQQILEVCLSPGCIADGAEETLSTLRAFAPPNTQVLPGKCASACGAGPVVLKGVVTNDDVNEKRTVCKRIAGGTLLNLLQNEGGEKEEKEQYNIPDEIQSGYNLFRQAKNAMDQKSYKEAIVYFQNAIEMALPIALAIHGNAGNDKDTPYPPALEWIIQAYQFQAEACLQLKQSQQALKAAQCGWELSNCTHRPCLVNIIQACYDLKDVKGDLEALRILLVEMEPEKDAATKVLNQRRELGFRLAKLEREANA